MKQQLKLFFVQDEERNWHVTDDNYDGAPDAGPQKEGVARNRYTALADYLTSGVDPAIDYVISGKDLI